jgi:hypothetical protein
MGMLVKTLNGDLLDVPTVKDAITIIAEQAGVAPARVKVKPVPGESIHFAWITLPTITITFKLLLEKIPLHKSTHPDIIAWIFHVLDHMPFSKVIETLPAIWANPCPKLVHFLLDGIRRVRESEGKIHVNSPLFSQFINENPNDEMINFVVGTPELWSPRKMCSNPNPRAVRLSIPHLNLDYFTPWFQIMKQPHPDLFEFGWRICQSSGRLVDLTFVAENAHAVPAIGEYILDNFEMYRKDYHLGSCTDDRVLQRYIDYIITTEEGTINSRVVPYPFCANPSDVAVDWLLTIEHTENFAFAANSNKRAVDYWLARLGENDENERFWYCFMRNSDDRAVDATVEWITSTEAKRAKRLGWFLTSYEQSVLNKNPRLMTQLLTNDYTGQTVSKYAGMVVRAIHNREDSSVSIMIA